MNENERVQAAIDAAVYTLTETHQMGDLSSTRHAINNVALVARVEALEEAVIFCRQGGIGQIEIRRNAAIRELEESMHSKREAR